MELNRSEAGNISATFNVVRDVEDPKMLGVRTGYSPHHKFPNIDWLASGKHTYDDMGLHYPGETLNVVIQFASWEHIRESVNVGDSFEVRENNRLIGYGIVNSIL